MNPSPFSLSVDVVREWSIRRGVKICHLYPPKCSIKSGLYEFDTINVMATQKSCKQ